MAFILPISSISSAYFVIICRKAKGEILLSKLWNSRIEASFLMTSRNIAQKLNNIMAVDNEFAYPLIC